VVATRPALNFVFNFFSPCLVFSFASTRFGIRLWYLHSSLPETQVPGSHPALVVTFNSLLHFVEFQ
jgi:hypothetical protein